MKEANHLRMKEIVYQTLMTGKAYIEIMYRIDYLLCSSDRAIGKRTGARRGQAKGIKYGRTSSSGRGQGRGRGRRQSRSAGRVHGRDSRQCPGSSILNEPGNTKYTQ